ncbi:Gene 36 protein (Gp36), probable excisionase [Mycobacteroides abscessus subsp. massiliense]|uniref:helix-turn-helix domain-containing protein n=1 Tax=Mycobacteroides abscessus TaxID=36809 RepID=UPI0009CAD464|nr:helix-turn-helix domain-containing protein [Mycobacteroides abscessus]SKR54866.1 Gene 36 protein (Gp36), probable excisionase [Mycobacteroides abscessus subsp. massiliense]SKR62739.1 Gene 36 protein (Gp36), probable excisionase [Mycobacteroides abscessus subsp. massiliense]SKT67645.1 Gene 36 protein (Gp36), probable excisionase [Mycobacteroides abscessus subsp. massiliense]SKT85994.1 Gene 36 protein (Gp36), probable excisionase [Mycobacteroides abscessus subsp. massiliense]SLA02310.1 Gene 3
MKRSASSPRLRLISIAEAAERLDVCPRTIRRYIAAGRFTAYRIGPRLIKIDPDELGHLLVNITVC